MNQFKTITRLHFCDRWWKHFSVGQFNKTNVWALTD